MQDSTPARKSLETNRLIELLTVTAPVVGHDFLQRLVEQLAVALQVRCVVLAKRVHPASDQMQMRTVAAWDKDKHLASFDYRLEGTSRAQVLEKAGCSYEGPVEKLFPANPTLNGWAVQSYFGLPLLDAHGRAIGVLEALHDDPISLPGDFVYVCSLLCKRAALEIQGLEVDQALGLMRTSSQSVSLEPQFLRAQRLQCLGEVAAGFAHDLSNILGFVAMAVPVLIKDAHGPESLKRLSSIETCARRGVDLVRQMVAFARGCEEPRALISPTQLVREVFAFVQQTFPSSIRVYCQAPEGVWTVFGNSVQLHQMLLNLAINARDAMPTGGVLQLSIANDDSSGSCGTVAERHVCFRITDTGSGIHPDVLARMFEPFFTTKPTGCGTGLGLAIVKRIVEAHGGRVEVASKPGKGTEFSIYLPAAAGQESSCPFPAGGKI